MMMSGPGSLKKKKQKRASRAFHTAATDTKNDENKKGEGKKEKRKCYHKGELFRSVL
jgi:hypothetical protein